MTLANKTFADLKATRYQWITVAEAQYYPDYLEDAVPRLRPILVKFGELLTQAASSVELYRRILQEPPDIRRHLWKIFRQYVAPMLSQQQMLRVGEAENIVATFGDKFRPLPEVRARFHSRPADDEAIIAIMEVTSTRGVSGYSLSVTFFSWFESRFGSELRITGPRGPGRDIMLNEALPSFVTPLPSDFLIHKPESGQPVAVGFVRYDKERGGSQEDDRIKNYRDAVTEILRWADDEHEDLKIIFVNDGPGLLMGSMWDDYASLEARDPARVLVVTLKMLHARLTRAWLLG